MSDNIAEGAVFYLTGEGISNHYHIIANVDAATNSALLIGVITSHVEMRKQDAEDMDESPDTIVDILPEQCSCLTHPSAVDCNEPLVIKKIRLQELVATNAAVFKCQVPLELTKKIRDGIRKSHSADMSAKGLV